MLTFIYLITSSMKHGLFGSLKPSLLRYNLYTVTFIIFKYMVLANAYGPITITLVKI